MGLGIIAAEYKNISLIFRILEIEGGGRWKKST